MGGGKKGDGKDGEIDHIDNRINPLEILDKTMASKSHKFFFPSNNARWVGTKITDACCGSS